MRRTLRRWGFATVAVALVAWAPLAAYTGTFSDDDGSIHEPNIEAIALAGITQGCDTTEFCPAAPVTRGQMASFLARGLGLPATPNDFFGDDNGSAHEININRVAEAGISLGCEAGKFCPNSAVTRAQMASFLVRALDLPAATAEYFSDDDGLIHEPNIDAIREAEITFGCDATGTLYCPSDPVSRGQMASFLARALGLDPVDPDPPAGDDPAFYSTPIAVGTGQRTITVPTSGSPTLQAAFDSALPGDTIVLAAGTHRMTSNVVLTRSGTASAWIEVRGADGARPIIDLQGLGELRISASRVLFEHLEVTGGAGNNIHIAPDTTSISHVVVRDVRVDGLVSGPGAAIKVNRNNTTSSAVSLVYIEDCDVSEAIGNAVIDGVGVIQAVVRDCWIHDNAVGSHGIFFKGGSDGVLIENNLISGIRGNAALQLGGSTGASFWNPTQPNYEGVDQVARNNLIVDFDDSGVEIRGVNRASVYHNTIVTQSDFAVFRLSLGFTSTSGSSDNVDVDIANNLVIATGGDPQYARNDGASTTVTFRRQLWSGVLHNSGAPTPGIPIFPIAGDIVVSSNSGIVVNPTSTALTGFADALARYAPVSGSPALDRGVDVGVTGDIVRATRSSTAPSIGAFENP
jgi:hypothetical protein